MKTKVNSSIKRQEKVVAPNENKNRSELRKNFFDKDTKIPNVQKLPLIKPDKNNTVVRKYFQKYSEICSPKNTQKMSRQLAQEVNSDDFLQIYPNHQFRGFSIISERDIDRVKYSQIFAELAKVQFDQKSLKALNLKLKESRAIGCMLGLAICDALGAPLEFTQFKIKGHNYDFQNFDQLRKLVEQKQIMPRFSEIGIWTDDFAMALGLAYNFILNDYNSNNPEHLRFMFHLWWNHGLGNGNRLQSVGLGGNISVAMDEFARYQKMFAQMGQNRQNKTREASYLNPESKSEQISIKNLQKVNEGNKDNNGNGSLMRLAPVAVLHYDSVERAMKAAVEQSLTTHNGQQAAQCCRLLAKILVDMINRNEVQNWRKVLLQSCLDFVSPLYQVQFLAQGLTETREMFEQKCKDPNNPRFKQFNQTIEDRFWRWKDPDFAYSPTRSKYNSEYFGSYCMDGLALALHCVYHTDSFKQCALKCAKLGGDCDTVGAIAGQIAGAIYGVNSEMLKLYSGMEDFKEERFEAFLVAKKLANQAKVIEADGILGWISRWIESMRRYIYWRNDVEAY